MDINNILKIAQILDKNGSYSQSDYLIEKYIKISQESFRIPSFESDDVDENNLNASHRVLNTFANWAYETVKKDRTLKPNQQNKEMQSVLTYFYNTMLDAKKEIVNVARIQNIGLTRGDVSEFIRPTTPAIEKRINTLFEDPVMIGRVYGKPIPEVQKLYMNWSKKQNDLYKNNKSLKQYLSEIDLATWPMAALTDRKLQLEMIDVVENRRVDTSPPTETTPSTETGTGTSSETSQEERLPADVQNYVGLLDSLTLIDDFPRSINQLTTRTRMVDSFETNLNKSYENRAITPDQYSHLKRQLVRMRKEIDDISKRIY